ncbi:MAG: hypothetical protein KGL93_11580 [Gemmatimonadota bacterium]|nr:hypothetical protein [Gemmatimonadota bacterium]
MRRHPAFRFSALAFALWFVALSLDVGGVDACPMHDGPGAVMATHGMAMPGMAMPGMADMAPAPAVMQGSGAPHAPTPAAPVHCTCMGLCCGCAALATVPAPSIATAPLEALRRLVLPPDLAWRPVAAATAYLQPPSIGPPALHTA